MSERMDLIAHYDCLLEQLSRLTDHLLATTDAPLWLSEEGKFIDNKSKLAEVYCHLHPSSDTPQQTFACPGAYGGTAVTLQLVQSVNAAKEQFRTIANQFLDRQSFRRTALVRQTLAEAGFGLVHLKQVYRHIQSTVFHPRRISFTRVKHSSHRVISREEAEKRLLKAGKGEHISIQLEKLARLRDKQLVVHHDVQPLWAANLASFKNSQGLSQTEKILTAMPVVYLHDDSMPLPEVGFSRRYEKHKPAARKDKRIENQPFLPSINAYRYL